MSPAVQPARMTAAMRRFQRAELRLRVARALMLQDLAYKLQPDQLSDLLTFASQVGDTTSADSLSAFRAAQEDVLQTAQAELRRLTG